ncbi:MAG: tRNA (N6-threonylcarbamoyladenosine(37)-N6)-methyltransferase TrmO [Candidatus Kapaibacterium sp.]
MNTAYTFEPIGFIRSPFRRRYTAPIQAETSSPLECVIELLPQRNFETALRDLEGFSHLWVLWVFHEATTWRPVIQTPRDGSKHGVFSTRSPHRPNPIGLSAVPLIGIDRRFVHIRGGDMINGTPVLDIKPYIADYDAFPEARGGWTDSLAARPQTTFAWSDVAAAQADFVTRHGSVDLRDLVERRLRLNPLPTASNRVEHVEGDSYILASRAWRIHYRLQGQAASIFRITSAYASKPIASVDTDLGPDDAAVHKAFLAWDADPRSH